MSTRADSWLVIIDPQVIFASQDSDWGSPFFPAAYERIRELAAAFGPERVIVTRWLTTAERESSWGAYFEAWPFADVPADDRLYELIEGAAGLTANPIVDRPTFGKWSDELTAITGTTPHLVLAGVSTDCCVLSTALAAADAGAWVTVAADACAGSDQANHDAAMHVMGLYPPQIEIADTAGVLAAR